MSKGCVRQGYLARYHRRGRPSIRPWALPPAPYKNQSLACSNQAPTIPAAHNRARPQGLAKPRSTGIRPDEQILQINSRPSFEGRKIMEEQGEALRHAINLANQHLSIRAWPEQLLCHHRLVKTHRMRQLFIFRQVANELPNKRYIGRRCSPYREAQAAFPCNVSMLTLAPASISAAFASTKRTIWLTMSSSST